jgi:hypothetical protein
VSFSPKSVRLLWFGIAVFGFLPIVSALNNQWNDWSPFWAAGGTVGTPALMNATLHTAWQVSRGVPSDYWRYPPAFAFAYWPASLFQVGPTFVANTAVMLALLGVSGVLMARIFELPRGFALRLAFAWTPALAAVDMGQNMPLAIVLALWAIDGLRRDSQIEVGLACGLLMYKPELGVFLLGLLVLRARWRAVAVAVALMAAWYIVSVLASAGDWGWPVTWWNGIQPWLAHDFAFNADKTVSVPGLLARLGVLPSWLCYLTGAGIVLLALRGLVRAPVIEAASATFLLALVAGPRVWSYEAGLMLPILAWTAAGGVAEPWRTRLILLAVPIGLLWIVSPLTVVSGVAVAANAAMVMWLWRWRPVGPDPIAQLAAPGAAPAA